MRLAEATALRWRDINFAGGRFAVIGGAEGTKNHEVREVPLFPAMRAFLERLNAEAEPQPDDLVIGITKATKAMQKACRLAQLQEFTHHSLRHYFVSNAVEVGIDFKVIAGWVGHKDGGLLVAKTYGHLRDTHSYAMAERMTFQATGGASL
jgi:integrase